MMSTPACELCGAAGAAAWNGLATCQACNETLNVRAVCGLGHSFWRHVGVCTCELCGMVYEDNHIDYAMDAPEERFCDDCRAQLEAVSIRKPRFGDSVVRFSMRLEGDP
jgi:hypothetical protein